MYTDEGQQNRQEKPASAARRPRRRKNKDMGDILRDFLERTGLNEDLEKVAADIARRGINNFWTQFETQPELTYEIPSSTQSRQAPLEDSDDPYVILGIHHKTPPDIIRAVYMAWVKNHHPDKGGDPELFKKVNVAYDQIKREQNL